MITTNLILLGITILASAFFAGAETGFVSWNPLKVSYDASRGNTYASMALFLMRRKSQVYYGP